MGSVGYSGTPLARKLGLKEGSLVALLAAPTGFTELLEPIPFGTALDGEPSSADVTVCFTSARADLEGSLGQLAEAIRPDRVLWVAWPKRSSGVATDVTEDVVRELALPLGLVDTKVCAIDATWSGLRLVWRKALR